jgi:hypothetical protein
MGKNEEGEKALGAVRGRVSEQLKKQDSLRVSMHIVPEKPKRKEGDNWTDGNGKRWEFKNGIAQSISKLQDARIPLWCPNCSVAMTHRFDTKMYGIHGKCFECVVKMEGKLRREGKWEEYERNAIKKNQISHVQYYIEMFESALEEVKNPQFVLEDGTLQNWSVNVKEVKANIQRDIGLMKTRLTKLLEEK